MAVKEVNLKDKKYRKPKRFFEKKGLVVPGVSYYVPLENVVNEDNEDIWSMIDRGRYFSIFAPRQSGKTTFFKETCRQLHKDATYVAITLSFQDNKSLEKKRFYELIERYLYQQLIDRLTEVKCEKIAEVKGFLSHNRLIDHISFRLLFEDLNQIIKSKKIVIFIDEFDGIPQGELENFLSALRELYQYNKEKKTKALYSVGLVGIRNITKLVVGGVSPFNIAEQVKLPPFSLKNVSDLYNQYSEETNQPFTPGAIQAVYEETSGQPWLVNRLGSILTIKVKPQTLEPIEKSDVQQAVDILLKENNDHFDNLYEKAVSYKESFIEIVFDHQEYIPNEKDQGLLEQHGLIKEENGKAVVSNNIYKARFTKTFFSEVENYQEKPLHR